MNSWTECTLLGAGGRNPRVDLWEPSGGQTYTLESLPPGSSAYALARSPDGSQIVVGTKTGVVTVWSLTDAPSPESAPHSWRLAHGHYPALGVAFVSPRSVALVNAAGGAWLYNTQSEHGNIKPLDTGGHTVCALSALPGNILAGLATDGRLVFWSLDQGQRTDEVPAPPPPKLVSLAFLHFWPEANLLLYPSLDGHLVAFHLDSGRMEKQLAHDGDSFFSFCAADRCLTFGTRDGLVKPWGKDLCPAGPPVKGPENVIGGGGLGEASSTLLLIQSDGTAGVHVQNETRLRLQTPLPGRDYRACLLPDAAAVAASHQAQARAEAARLVQDLQTTHRNATERATLLQQLEGLGYRHASLAVQVEQALEAEDLPAALSHSSALVQLLPWSDPKSQPSLKRHLDLLTRAALFREWEATLERMARAFPQPLASIDLERKATLADALSDPLVTSEPDLPFPTMCDCAAGTDRSLHGRFVVKRLRTLACRGTEITAEALVTKYLQLCSEERLCLPTAAAHVIPYISARGVVRRPSVLLAEASLSGRPTFELCLSLESAQSLWVISPLVVFVVPQPESETTVTEHNACLRDIYLQMKSQDATRFRLKTLLEVSVLALRRLLTLEAGLKV